MIQLPRRQLLATGASFAAASLAPITSASAAETLPPTCADRTPTQAWESPPEYLAGAPERTSFLEPGIPGADDERLTLTGRVLTTRCEPVPGARVEFWHTNLAGKYDMVGFRFRGYQRTDKDGRFRLETVMPGYYSAVRHVHFLVGAHMPGRLQPQLLANVVELASEKEEKTVPETPGRSRRPTVKFRENGVLTVSYDIMVEAV